MEEALATLDEAMDRCLSVPLFARSSEQLVGYLDRLHAHQQRLAAVQAALVRELEVLEVPRRHGATSTMAWLRTRYRISPGAAKRLATLAQATADRTPAVTAALEAGTVKRRPGHNHRRTLCPAFEEPPGATGTARLVI